MVVVDKGSCHPGHYLVGGLAFLIRPLRRLSNLLPFLPVNGSFGQDAFEALVGEQVDLAECWKERSCSSGGEEWNGSLRTERSTAAERAALPLREMLRQKKHSLLSPCAGWNNPSESDQGFSNLAC